MSEVCPYIAWVWGIRVPERTETRETSGKSSHEGPIEASPGVWGPLPPTFPEKERHTKDRAEKTSGVWGVSRGRRPYQG